MKNFIISFIATLFIVMIRPVSNNVIADKPIIPKEDIPILSTLDEPVHAEKQELAQVPVEPPKPAPAPVYASWVDQCHAWAAQAGIALDNAAITLIGKESKCNPNAQNPTSTAYGIGQFLNSTWAGTGCVKTPDPVQQLKCMHTYVTNRYNSWQGALNFHYANNWY